MGKLLGLFRRKKNIALTDQEILDLDFDREVLSILKRVSDNNLHELKIMDFVYEDQPVETGVYFTCSEQEAEKIVLDLQSRLQHSGCLAFISERDYSQGEKTKIAIIKGTDQFEILKVMQTNGENYDVSNADVISKLTQWNKQHPFTIIGANLDWVEANFEVAPTDQEIISLAEETYDFCPDVVDQGTESVEELIKEMKESQKIILWWD